jgi:wyosine [tRNA(Phe)-imidazoG37] synthetase (radical SAM superfamily)
METYQFLYGPVPSRRLGRSLGVDLTPLKTCSFDCVFCQLGKTTVHTLKRQEYIPTDSVLSELKSWLKKEESVDYITLSGSGEPTLHSRFGEVISFIRDNCSTRTALLTNGSLLHLPEVRRAASHAHVVKISLSAWDQASYHWINRPHPDLTFKQLIEGQRAFREQFPGEIWLEVFLVAGTNAISADVMKIADLAQIIGPDRIHLNTAVRPPVEGYAAAVSQERLSAMIHLFHPTADIIAEFRPEHSIQMRANRETILSLLKRRPCRADQIAEAFGMHLSEVSKYLRDLMRNDQIRMKRQNSSLYYSA